MSDQKWIVLKFGGTSVSTRTNWQNIKDIAKNKLKENDKVILVCSALSGISNELEGMLKNINTISDDKIEAIIKRHLALAKEMEIKDFKPNEFEILKRLLKGIELTGEASPKISAQVMACGELMSTQLGSLFLKQNKLNASFVDIRKYLKAKPSSDNQWRKYCSCEVDFSYDKEFKESLSSISAEILITQGFIASDENCNTVLLGRGGSDTSATIIASKINAEKCEIWTDVPGLFTANPHAVPEARLLMSLEYKEAQEIASTGAKVLHPKCLYPVMKNDIPLQICWTDRPDFKGTLISSNTLDQGASVKSISLKRGITLVSMDTIGMWHQVGFLANIFSIFKDLDLSIDLVSTSEANLTVSLDHTANAINPEILEELILRLSNICSTKIISSCSAISLVGRNIRSILHKISSALKVFEEQKIYLVSQAASDLNITFVLDDEKADKLVVGLHELLFKHAKTRLSLGPTWTELFADSEITLDQKPFKWWQKRKDDLLKVAQEIPCAYVYNKELIEKRATQLKSLTSISKTFYSIKANSNPEILKILESLGLGFECVSLNEVKLIKNLFSGIENKRILFTPNFASKYEFENALKENVLINLDSTYPLKSWSNIFKNKDIFLRIDPGLGKGHHSFVKTAGLESKFGISPNELPQVLELCKNLNCKIIGLHAHAGSGIFDSSHWLDMLEFLYEISKSFDHVKIINVGGGLGVPERPDQENLNLKKLDKLLNDFKKDNPDIEIWMEPGRFLVAEAGVLISKVNQIKTKGDITYIGTSAGMNSFIRPMLYGSWHEIVNLSKLDKPLKMLANIVGPICESGDTLGFDRCLPETCEDDVLLIANTGAYGYSMSSNYNQRKPAEELLI
ncbi:MAG: bifunctional aspartate kinase/diaminopimelate decarboxylase [Pseudomonadota bacterium]